jgi:hypothetical protein
MATDVVRKAVKKCLKSTPLDWDEQDPASFSWMMQHEEILQKLWENYLAQELFRYSVTKIADEIVAYPKRYDATRVLNKITDRATTCGLGVAAAKLSHILHRDGFEALYHWVKSQWLALEGGKLSNSTSTSLSEDFKKLRIGWWWHQAQQHPTLLTHYQLLQQAFLTRSQPNLSPKMQTEPLEPQHPVSVSLETQDAWQQVPDEWLPQPLQHNELSADTPSIAASTSCFTRQAQTHRLRTRRKRAYDPHVPLPVQKRWRSRRRSRPYRPTRPDTRSLNYRMGDWRGPWRDTAAVVTVKRQRQRRRVWFQQMRVSRWRFSASVSRDGPTVQIAS